MEQKDFHLNQKVSDALNSSKLLNFESFESVLVRPFFNPNLSNTLCAFFSLLNSLVEISFYQHLSRMTMVMTFE